MAAMMEAAIILMAVAGCTVDASSPPAVDTGVPAGLLPQCPGVLKNATISTKTLEKIQIMVYHMEGGELIRKPFSLLTISKVILKEKYIDLINKKTVLYAVGYLDRTSLAHNKAIATSYAKRGYNVMILETAELFMYAYPTSARITRTIGRLLGELLVRLASLGLNAKNLEILGMSLGAHVASFTAKTYFKVTGKKPSLLVGLDPAGPCFRNLDPEDRFDVSDAEKVVVLHTNIDGFGLATPIGHVDFYANGGEFQPGDIIFIPCLVVCSHLKALLYWADALDNPKSFIGVKCDSVKDARYADCFQKTIVTNNLGLDTDFEKPGIYYLPTKNYSPYGAGKEGLKPENDIITTGMKQINAENKIVV